MAGIDRPEGENRPAQEAGLGIKNRPAMPAWGVATKNCCRGRRRLSRHQPWGLTRHEPCSTKDTSTVAVETWRFARRLRRERSAPVAGTMITGLAGNLGKNLRLEAFRVVFYVKSIT